MSKGAGLDWGVLPLGGWEANSKAFKGDYVIEVGHDGLFFVTKRTNIIRPRQCEHVEHIGPDFQTLELAKSFCEQYEYDLLSEHKTRPAGNASTFGPVPASQERVESALDEDIRLGMTISRIRHIHSQIGPAFKAIGDFLNSLK